MGYYCNKCHKSISAGIYHYSTENYGKALCRDHQENVLRIRKNKSGYRQFFDRRANKWKFTHRRVAEKKLKGKIFRGHEVHHKNENKNDNRLFDIAQVEFVFRVNNNDAVTTETIYQRSDNDYYKVIPLMPPLRKHRTSLPSKKF